MRFLDPEEIFEIADQKGLIDRVARADLQHGGTAGTMVTASKPDIARHLREYAQKQSVSHLITVVCAGESLPEIVDRV